MISGALTRLPALKNAATRLALCSYIAIATRRPAWRRPTALMISKLPRCAPSRNAPLPRATVSRISSSPSIEIANRP